MRKFVVVRKKFVDEVIADYYILDRGGGALVFHTSNKEDPSKPWLVVAAYNRHNWISFREVKNAPET